MLLYNHRGEKIREGYHAAVRQEEGDVLRCIGRICAARAIVRFFIKKSNFILFISKTNAFTPIVLAERQHLRGHKKSPAT
ncbi:MAG: hypothetical protein ACI4QS_07920 [Comamonas sp.]